MLSICLPASSQWLSVASRYSKLCQRLLPGPAWRCKLALRYAWVERSNPLSVLAHATACIQPREAEPGHIQGAYEP